MPATPRRSRRFGGTPAHQRLLMANLVASLIAAEAIVTTEGKAKATPSEYYHNYVDPGSRLAKAGRTGPSRAHGGSSSTTGPTPPPTTGCGWRPATS